MNKPTLTGLHHVTAITADAQRNINFYSELLGLRFVKRTVNFDDPTSYHLYYGDELGRPGTAMTFFAWNGGRRGRCGPPQATVTQFAVPEGSLTYWQDRLAKQNAPFEAIRTPFDEAALSLRDPDHMTILLVESAQPGGEPPDAGPVPADYALRGFHGVTLALSDPEPSELLLTNVMGYSKIAENGDYTRLRAAESDQARYVDIWHAADQSRGVMGTGIVHHIAFRAPNDEHQKVWQREIQRRGFDVSPVRDRCYFHSIYFREPGGVLFEIATDEPGFTADEAPEYLGSALKLPPWLEPERNRLQAALPPVNIPSWR